MTDQLTAGVELMLVGMGIVFLFLAMLIVAVNLMSAIILRFFPSAPASPTASGSKSGDPSVIAAIAAAIHQYRSKHQ